jgi:hypothetical protein
LCVCDKFVSNIDQDSSAGFTQQKDLTTTNGNIYCGCSKLYINANAADLTSGNFTFGEDTDIGEIYYSSDVGTEVSGQEINVQVINTAEDFLVAEAKSAYFDDMDDQGRSKTKFKCICEDQGFQSSQSPDGT